MMSRKQPTASDILNNQFDIEGLVEFAKSSECPEPIRELNGDVQRLLELSVKIDRSLQQYDVSNMLKTASK